MVLAVLAVLAVHAGCVVLSSGEMHGVRLFFSARKCRGAYTEVEREWICPC